MGLRVVFERATAGHPASVFCPAAVRGGLEELPAAALALIVFRLTTDPPRQKVSLQLCRPTIRRLGSRARAQSRSGGGSLNPLAWEGCPVVWQGQFD